MSKTDWAVLGLNALAFLVAIVGFSAFEQDLMDLGMLLALAALTVNSVLLIRRANQRPQTLSEPDRDSLDAHQILDLDARLEAFERAEAHTLRALAGEGVVRGPAPELDAEHVRAARPVSNGRG